MTDEAQVRAVLARIDAAWREKRFEGLDACFHPDARIVGPGYNEFARGRVPCAESYREFATNADVLEYAESDHKLAIFGATAVATFAWRMTYRRDGEPNSEQGTDQLVLAKAADGWQVVWRHIHFAAQE